MKTQHPNDRQLLQYLNRMCSELEFNHTAKHIQICASCRTRLHAFIEMESVLDQMPLMTAPPLLEDRIMKSISKGASRLSDTNPSPRQQPSSVSRRRSELINGLIAVAATFLFINSGILGKIMSINANNWGEGVQNQLIAIESVVTRLSLQLLS
jgi:hypothetical protein